MRQEKIPVYGDGSNIRDWLYVDDHCKGIDTVIRKGALGEKYNIGGNNEWSNIDIAKTICSIFDEHGPSSINHQSLIEYVTDRPGHDWRYAIDSTRIDQELQWRPLETFKSGIRKTIEFYGAPQES